MVTLTVGLPAVTASVSNMLLKILILFLKMIWETNPQHRLWHTVDVQPSSVGKKETKTEGSFAQTQEGMSQPGTWLSARTLCPHPPGRFDHLVAIERAGRAADGNYYNQGRGTSSMWWTPLTIFSLQCRRFLESHHLVSKGHWEWDKNTSALKAFFIDCWTHDKKELYGTIVFHFRDGLCLFWSV